MNCFDSIASIKTNSGLDELEFISVILNHFLFTDTVTIPIPPFFGDVNDRDTLHFFDKKLEMIENIGKKYNLKMALEPQPGSLAADLSYLNRIDSIVMFNALKKEDIRKITMLELDDVKKREGIVKRKIKLHFSKKLINFC